MTNQSSNAEIRMKEFYAEVMALGQELDNIDKVEQGRHFLRYRNAVVVTYVLAYVTAWIAINPISIFLLALAIHSNWLLIAHHIIHGAYDSIPGIPERLKKKNFANGWRRWIQWPDYFSKKAWIREHNQAHHSWFHRGYDTFDDFFIFERLRDKIFYTFFSIPLLKPLYNVPCAVDILTRKRSPGQPFKIHFILSQATFVNLSKTYFPISRLGRRIWAMAYLPYFSYRFVVVPVIFLPLGTKAALFVLVNSLVAEIVTSAWTACCNLPSHAAPDLIRFTEQVRSREEELVAMIVGTVNFRHYGDWRNYLVAFINYHIEHHVWPGKTLLQYQIGAPKLKAICQKYGVPYIQDSIWKRLWITVYGTALQGRRMRSYATPTAFFNEQFSEEFPIAKCG